MKKLLAIAASALMIFSLAACTGNDASSNVTTTKADGTTATTGGAGGEILIGCLQDVTGATSTLG